MTATKKSPSTVFPTGWFQVGWSDELDIGESKPMRYFAQDLVVYRGETGNVNILDAYCPHLGAHLGYQYENDVIDDKGNRRIEGDNLRCPWHGWCWGPDGKNVDIPYSRRRHTGRGVRAWHAREANGFILIWHDALGREPHWEPPELPECQPDSGYYPSDWTRREWRNITVGPQMVIENAVDFEHLRYVHGHAGEITVLKSEIDGHRFSSWVATDFNITTGKRPGNYPGQIQPNLFGIGLAAIRLSGIIDQTHIVNVTPVDEDVSDCFGALVVKKVEGHDEPTNLVRAVVKQEHTEFNKDMLMWGNARFVAQAPFPPEEKGFRDLRRWARQFYPDESMLMEADAPAT